MQETQPNPGKGLGIASLATSLLGLYLVGLVLGIIGLQKSKKVNQSNGLALAGIIVSSVGMVFTLIIVLIFLAVPLMQGNSRDTSRKADVVLISSEVIAYQTDNLGKLPMASDLSVNTVIIDSIVGSGRPSQETALYTAGEDCDGVSGPRNYSVTVLLEDDTEYCAGS